MKIDFIDFPKSLFHQKGWPWEYDNFTDNSLKTFDLPKISIITPSFNQGEFIEETIRSIILQNYPNLEYIIVDGGSSDQTLAIIEKYRKWIDIFISEPDKGQSDAINKGWKLATGQVTTWINSDDYLAPNCLFEIAKLSADTSDRTLFVGKVVNFDDVSKDSYSLIQKNISFKNVIRFWEKKCVWHQPGIFFPMKLIIENNYLDEQYHYSMDFDLLCKILPHTTVKYSGKIFTYFRLHNISKGVASPQSTVNEKVLIATKYWVKSSKNKLEEYFYFIVWFLKYFIKSLFSFSFKFKFNNILNLLLKWI